MRRWILALLIASGAAVAVHAAEADDCGKFKWSVARERAWMAAGPSPVAATAAISVGDKAYRVQLAEVESLRFDAPPERAPKPATRAGALKFEVAQTGVYDVGLSGEGWIDVVQNGAAVASSDFSGQKNCPGFHKSVRFALVAGPATLQLSNIANATIDVAIAPAP